MFERPIPQNEKDSLVTKHDGIDNGCILLLMGDLCRHISSKTGKNHN